MTVTTQESSLPNQTDRDPLLTDRQQDHKIDKHIVDFVTCGDTSSSGQSNNDNRCPHASGISHDDDIHSSNRILPSLRQHSSFSTDSNSGILSTARISDNERGIEPWNPFNSTLWFIIRFVFIMSQIIASLGVLFVSVHEKPQAPLFSWIVGYCAAYVACLPVLYWHWILRCQATDLDSTQSRQRAPQGNSMLEPNPYITISVAPFSEEEDSQNTSAATLTDEPIGAANASLSGIMDHFKMALDCFFAVWFVVGNVWIFGGHADSSEAPILYMLCTVFLTISCIGYAMPFILCAIICCCLPCVISILRRSGLNKIRGATEESINALPAYRFKSNRVRNDKNIENSLEFEGGILAAGTENERTISGEDAVCSICLEKYLECEELRELPCSHFFHTECVDKWLKMNATCPLCKFEIGDQC